MPIDLTRKYERELQKAMEAATKQIRKYYEQSILEVSLKASTIDLKDKPFSLSLYPLLDRKVEEQVDKLYKQTYNTIVDSVKKSWALSNDKNDEFVDKRLAGKEPTDKARQILYDPNNQALAAFLKRKVNGMNLSDRVWNSSRAFRNEMEQGLGLGIKEGRSAADLATELKQYLNEPDKLFRRVRGKDGKLRLSQAARNYHPGQGVYRSSYKNAYRLTRTENNIAYRSSDFERWQTLPFVLGIQIKTSGNHPEYDICDTLAGKYPKDFKWTGWHPQCMCYMVPELMSDEEYGKYEDMLLGLGEFDLDSLHTIDEPPAAFIKYIKENEQRIKGWNNKPYWLTDNPHYTGYDDQSSGKEPKKKAAQQSPTPAELPKILKLGPAGNPIQPQFTNIAKGIQNQVDIALSNIDKVHGDGILDDIPFKKSTSDSFQAAFYSSSSGKAVYIALSTKSKHPPLSLIHEMGHYLDFYSVGQRGKFASLDKDSAIQQVLEVAKESQSVKDIQAMLDTKKISINGVDMPISKRGLETIKYYLEPEEIWARAYAQFIAKRSGSELLSSQLESMLERKEGFVFSQWDHDDFEKIDQAIEELFTGLGWMTNQ